MSLKTLKKALSACFLLGSLAMAVEPRVVWFDGPANGDHIPNLEGGKYVCLFVTGPYDIEIEPGQLFELRFPSAPQLGCIEGKSLELADPSLEELKQSPVYSAFADDFEADSLSGANGNTLIFQGNHTSEDGWQVHTYQAGNHNGLRSFALRTFDPEQPDENGNAQYFRSDLIMVKVQAHQAQIEAEDNSDTE